MSAAPVHNITYLDDDDVTEVRITDTTPRNPYAMGYGPKIPSDYMLRIGTRWHRVYYMVYSNSGTPYVIKGGADLILDTTTEHRMEQYREAHDKPTDRWGVGAPTPQPVRLDTLSPYDVFAWHHDGITSTLLYTYENSGTYRWLDYDGEHYRYAGTVMHTGKRAWPYVFATPGERQYDPTYCAEKEEFGTCIHSDHTR